MRILSERDGLPDDLEADLVVAGIGVTPNTQLAEAAGLRVDNGVHADERLVAADGVWVVGDIAAYQSVIHKRRIRIEHWDVALNTGAYVGRCWANAEDGPYEVVPYFFSDLADWTWMEYVGPGSPTDKVDVRGSMADDDFVAYYTDADGKLTACLGVNRSDEVNEAKELLAGGRRRAELALHLHVEGGAEAGGGAGPAALAAGGAAQPLGDTQICSVVRSMPTLLTSTDRSPGVTVGAITSAGSEQAAG